MAGIYIHIPFCKSRCIYCGFYSTTMLDLRHKYVRAVCREMELRRSYVDEAVETVYLGGGTPSLLGVSELDMLFQYIYKVFKVTADAEITMECNPDDINEGFIDTLARTPVNRISLGVQTFSDARLKLLRRRHDTAEVTKAVSLLRRCGIGNISIDLMFGFPGETLDDWTADISKALELNVEHISAYSLMYEEGTKLFDMLEHGQIREIDDELSLKMYDELTARLTLNGYEHYEISNFARHGYRSRHNGNYWRQVPYIGLGAAAHSFDLKSRQWNVADVKSYIEGIDMGEVRAERETLTPETTFNDIITTVLRTREGVDLEYIGRHLGKHYKDFLTANSARYVSEGLMETDGSHVRLTHKGIYISDMIMSELMMV